MGLILFTVRYQSNFKRAWWRYRHNEGFSEDCMYSRHLIKCFRRDIKQQLLFRAVSLRVVVSTVMRENVSAVAVSPTCTLKNRMKTYVKRAPKLSDSSVT